jgi:hypothetical protein
MCAWCQGFYNLISRTKRLSQQEILQIEKEKLEEDVHKLSQENQIISSQLDSIRQKFHDLQNYAQILKTKKSVKK